MINKILKIVSLLLFVVGIFIIFKVAMWSIYKSCISDIDDLNRIIEGYRNSKDITISKKEYLNYLEFKWLSIGNFFDDFVHDPSASTIWNETYYQYVGNKKVGVFSIGTFDSIVSASKKGDVTIFYGEDDNGGLSFGNIFYSGIDKFVEDRKIKDDVDLIRELSKYDFDRDYSVFTPISVLREDYSIRLITSITLPSIDSIYYINGNFKGYILEIINEKQGISCFEVNLFRNGRRYVITVLSKDFNLDKIVEIVSTIKLK